MVKVKVPPVASMLASITFALDAGAQSSAQTPSINSASQGRAAVSYTPVPQQAFKNYASHPVVVSNDLGKHCAGLDSRILSILPPINIDHAQVMLKAAKLTFLLWCSVAWEGKCSA